jgi:hypothetical protein
MASNLLIIDATADSFGGCYLSQNDKRNEDTILKLKTLIKGVSHV